MVISSLLYSNIKAQAFEGKSITFFSFSTVTKVVSSTMKLS